MICGIAHANALQLCMFYGGSQILQALNFSLHSDSANPMPVSFSLLRLGS